MAEELIWTATIRRPFGVTGEVRIHTHNAEHAHLAKLDGVVVRSRDGSTRTIAIEGVRTVSGEAVIKFRGYDSPERARELSGEQILVPRSDAAPLKKGEYYVADLIGCTLVHEGVVLATVESTAEGGQALLLEVRTDDGRVHYVPFMKEYTGAVDLVGRTIELTAPWILE
jgi:16S rRNA processing protein RimM